MSQESRLLNSGYASQQTLMLRVCPRCLLLAMSALGALPYLKIRLSLSPLFTPSFIPFSFHPITLCLACSCMPGAGVGMATWVMARKLTGNTCCLFCLAYQKGRNQAALEICCVGKPEVYLTFFLRVLHPRFGHGLSMNLLLLQYPSCPD